MNRGIWYGLGAYVIWGVLPIFWKLLQHVSSPQVLGHRIIWSFFFLLAVMLVRKRWHGLRTGLRDKRALVLYAVSTLLIGVNWLTYIWAVNAGFIVETSLGYFINPLLSIALGTIFLGERLRRWQWVAIGLATSGVIYLTFVYGTLPWIALCLALTFGFYGLVKKVAPLGSLDGLTLETGLLLVPAAVFLVIVEKGGQGAFLHLGGKTDLLLILAGLMTTVPLLLFTAAARRAPLSVIGIIQYVAPSMQFCIGVLIYHEPFSRQRFLGFAIVWAALAVFVVEGWAHRRSVPDAGGGNLAE